MYQCQEVYSKFVWKVWNQHELLQYLNFHNFNFQVLKVFIAILFIEYSRKRNKKYPRVSTVEKSKKIS